MTQRIWFITGISSGIGKHLAKAVMASGDFVIGTFRKPQQADDFNNEYRNKALGIVMDITSSADIHLTCKLIYEQYHRIDVLVNNAGIGFAGAIEEASMEEARYVMEVNFFGVLQLTRAMLPLLRQQRSGHIIQVSSHGGFKAFAGFGIYNASKFALEGFSEALESEIAPLGIKLTLVEPGPFRTNFAGAAFQTAETVIDDYGATAGAFRNRMKQVNGHQEGDPAKAAQAIISITHMDTPPLRLPLGKIAVLSLNSKLESVQRNVQAYTALAESVVYDS